MISPVRRTSEVLQDARQNDFRREVLNRMRASGRPHLSVRRDRQELRLLRHATTIHGWRQHWKRQWHANHDLSGGAGTTTTTGVSRTTNSSFLNTKDRRTLRTP